MCVLLRNMHAVALAQVDTAPQSDLFISFSRYVLMRNMHAVALLSVAVLTSLVFLFQCALV